MPDVSRNGTALFQRGLAFLTDAEALVGQRDQGGDSWKVSAAPAIGALWTPVADRGCSVIVAGQGRWLAFLAGYGVFGPQGLISASMSIGADVQACRGKAAPDGTVALVKDYQRGEGLHLLAINGEVTADVPDAQPLGQVAVVDRTRALWADRRGGIRTCGGLPVPVTLPGPVLWPWVLLASGVPWLLYHSTDANGLVLHPFDSLKGYALARPPAFYPLGVTVSGPLVAVAWATNPADSDGHVRAIDISKEPRVDLADLAPQPPAPSPQPPTPNPVAEPKPMPAFSNHLDVVQRERAKFPQSTLTEEQCFTVTNAVASDPAVKADGWGLTKAPAGGSGWVVNGQNYRLDKLCHPSGYINDILSDTPGAAGAQWGPNPDANGNSANWAAAVALGSEPPPSGPPPAQPPAHQPAVDLSVVLAALAEIRATQQAQAEWMKDVDEKLEVLTSRPASAAVGPMHGSLAFRGALKALGMGDVDLVPGVRS